MRADIVVDVSSLALYRRYRPETFAEVIGQEHVTGPLQQALRNNRVNHAYLFSGPRGCGKTTSARILARCLNCEQGPTPTPCGECQSCRDLARNGRGSIDVIEIDAASHGGVDDARELREKAFFGPASSRYKIYIIDEAHMVTSAGFNALLKVVEEPPAHLKFIFATTEPEKVIGTIRSRTHHYPFRLVPPGTLRDYLGEVCEHESIPVEDGVLPLVVRAGAGSVRDSMSVMDQLLAGAGEEGVTYAMATALLGYTEASLLDAVVDAFATHDGGTAFEIVNRVIEGGNDPRRFVADLLERLRDLVILAAVPDAAAKGLIDAPADVVERMAAQASVFGAAELSRAADLVNEGLTEMRGATSPRLQMELICARVLLPAAFDDERSVQARLARLERGAPTGGPATGAGSPPQLGYVPGPDAHPVHPAPQAQAASSAPSAPAGAASDSRPSQAQAQGGQRPEAWRGGAASGPPSSRGGAAARRTGEWPSAAAPGQGGVQGQGAAPGGEAASRGSSVAQPAGSAAPAQPSAGMDQGVVQVRRMWPDILEAVKNRRRFTWILLSQNAQVMGFDGTTLQLGFSNPGARDSFVGGGSEDVLRQALSDALGVQWTIEAIVDPSGGAGSPTGPQGGAPAPGSGLGGGGGSGSGSGFSGPASDSGFGGGGRGGPSSGSYADTSAPSRPVSPQASSAPPAAPPPRAAGPAPAPAPAPEPAPGSRSEREAEPPPIAPRDNMSLEDDPAPHHTALSGHDLIVRELGATVVEEFTSE